MFEGVPAVGDVVLVLLVGEWWWWQCCLVIGSLKVKNEFGRTEGDSNKSFSVDLHSHQRKTLIPDY
jgi:hypothetical protein